MGVMVHPTLGKVLVWFVLNVFFYDLIDFSLLQFAGCFEGQLSDLMREGSEGDEPLLHGLLPNEIVSDAFYFLLPPLHI